MKHGSARLGILLAAGLLGSTSSLCAQSKDPHLLGRGGDSRSAGILVVVNGVRTGGVNELRQIEAAAVQSIHYIKGPEAVGIYGYQQAGVIEVTLTMGPRKPD